jgi:hypothetical protein
MKVNSNTLSSNRDLTVKIRVPFRTTTPRANTSNQTWAILNKMLANLSSLWVEAREFKAQSTQLTLPISM